MPASSDTTGISVKGP